MQLFQAGAEVPVEYSGYDPEWARLSGTTQSTFGYVGLFGLAFPIAGPLMLIFSVCVLVFGTRLLVRYLRLRSRT